MSDIKTYKLRAEATVDLLNFVTTVSVSNYIDQFEVEQTELELVLTFDSTASLMELIAYAKSVEDGHVMAQTIQPIEEYTGVRDFER